MNFSDFWINRDYRTRAFNIIYKNDIKGHFKENNSNVKNINEIKFLKLRQNTQKIKKADSQNSSDLRALAIEILDS